MPQIYGQLQSAATEILSSDPSSSVQGRFWFNSTSFKFMLDDGTNKRAMLRNDGKCVFGNSGTASSNIRLHRGGAAVIQLVTGDDTTTEGTLSTSLAQVSAKLEGYAAASKPLNGNAGRVVWVSDSKILAVDDGTNWLSQVDTSTAQTLTNKTLTAPAVDVPLFTDQGSDPSAPGTGKTTLYTKGGHVYKIANGGSATQLAEVGVTPAETVTAKSTTYTALTSDDTILCSGASWTLTLYTAVGNKGKKLRIVHGGTSLSQVYTLNTTSGQTIGSIASGSYALYTNGEVLTVQSDDTNWVIIGHQTLTAWASVTPTLTATSAYVFTVTAANATVGAVYSNNSQTFTVTTTISAGTTLTCSGTGSPSASGTLTKVSGTGDATITFSSRTVTGVPVIGTNTTNLFKYRRNGSNMEFSLDVLMTASGTAGNGTYLYGLPAGATLDTTVVQTNGLSTTAAVGTTLGNGIISNASTGLSSLSTYARLLPYNNSLMAIAWNSGSTNTMTLVNTSQNPNFGSSAFTLHLSGSIPISGWQP